MFNFDEMQASEEDQKQLSLFMEKIRMERNKSAFDPAQYTNILGTEALMNHLEDNFLLDTTRWN